MKIKELDPFRIFIVTCFQIPEERALKKTTHTLVDSSAESPMSEIGKVNFGLVQGCFAGVVVTRGIIPKLWFCHSHEPWEVKTTY